MYSSNVSLKMSRNNTQFKKLGKLSTRLNHVMSMLRLPHATDLKETQSEKTYQTSGSGEETKFSEIAFLSPIMGVKQVTLQ